MKLIKADSIALAKFCDETHDYRKGWDDAIDAIEDNAEAIELEEHEDKFSDMITELLKWEERNDMFNLTTRERARFQQYVNERMEL